MASVDTNNHYDSRSEALDRLSTLMVQQGFQEDRGLNGRPWQVDAVKHVVFGSPSKPAAGADSILLVHSTGGGKSAVRDVSGLLLGRIVLTVVPLLSLSADQTSKMAAFIRD